MTTLGYAGKLVVFVLFLMFLMEYIDVFIDWVFKVLRVKTY